MPPADAGLILVVTHGEDPHADRVLAALEQRGVPSRRFDTELYPRRSHVTYRTADEDVAVEFELDGRPVRGADIRAVLYRHRRLPAPPAGTSTAAKPMIRSELLATLDGALLSLDALWINHPQANRLARHKPLQLTVAREAGLPIPPTCITANADTIRERFRAWNGEMVAKLVGGQVVEPGGETPYAIHTTRLTAADLADEGALAASPAIYQRLLPKAADVRVTVVGEEIFACRIDSQADPEARVDWRGAGRGALRSEPFTLDTSTAKRCLAVCRRLGLETAGIDLILMPDGRLVFLEVNAAGQWLWVEEATGLPIAAALAERLMQGSQAEARPRWRPAPVR